VKHAPGTEIVQFSPAEELKKTEAAPVSTEAEETAGLSKSVSRNMSPTRQI